MTSDASKFRLVVIVPTYNNGRTLADVVRGIQVYITDVIVVDDGSTDDTAAVLSHLSGIETLATGRNRGKGNALAAGFSKAVELGYTHAITLDADGQHLTTDLPLFLKGVAEDAECLWIGRRVKPVDSTAQPALSRFGARFGAFWYHFNTGIQIADTQCGFRAYPLGPVLRLGCKTQGYEYELDVLIRAAWSKIPIRELDIHLFYQPVHERVSHFRPLRDFCRIGGINSKAAMTRIFFPWRFMDVPGKNLGEKIRNLIVAELKAHSSPPRAAAALSLGTCFALMPIHGFQVMALMGLCLAFRLNKALAMIGVSISSAPLLPFWIALSYVIGAAILPAGILDGALPGVEHLSRHLAPVLAVVRPASSSVVTVLVQWAVGSVALALGYARRKGDRVDA